MTYVVFSVKVAFTNHKKSNLRCFVFKWILIYFQYYLSFWRSNFLHGFNFCL